MSEFVVGQRWISHTETNLGLGVVVEVMHRRVVMNFPAAGEQRVYASNNSPLGRIVYKQHDIVKDMQGHNYKVKAVSERAGLVFYSFDDEHGKENLLPEIELDCFVHFNTPKDRLLAGQIDPIKFFNLRQDCLQYLRNYQQSQVQGLLGPRIQLLPHQLYVAYQVANRNAPRVLLADEVGLGKTIEAGLIVHQQLQTGMAQRVLILVPDNLLHQWLLEMRRRFNLPFSILNVQMCDGAFDDQENPFEASQLALCPLSFVVEYPKRFEQVVACDWDLLVVDEAHHLEWTEQKISVEYKCVETLAKNARGVLLLTATPEQLGMEGHFARLHLLDPDRYYDLQTFLAEENDYQAVNYLVQALIRARETLAALPQGLDDFLNTQELQGIVDMHTRGDIETACDQALNALLDRYGTGRVLFRNTRIAMRGFPERVLFSYPLPAMCIEQQHAALNLNTYDALFPENIFAENWLQNDARVTWLVEWLAEHANEQVLLICAQAKTALELEEYLRTRYAIRSAVFHENMTLLARDRAAAYFADEERAAQILVCSEIGSEGRNFQFVHHIILFDLPLNPDLLEQRVGRLDRIGQKFNICIHVPFYQHSAQEILFNWYDQGLNAFSQTCAFGHAVFLKYQTALLTCLENKEQQMIAALISDTKIYANDLRKKLHAGRDQLLELNSCRMHEAEKILNNLIHCERRKDLESFIERSCDQLGIDVEAHSSNAIVLRPSAHTRCGMLPSMEEEGITATYSRDTALQREDLHFLSWEHPVAKGILEYILNSHHGNVAFATIKLKPFKPDTLLLEVLFNVECIAPSRLRLSRYLPATVIRVLVNIEGKDLHHLLTTATLNGLVKSVPMQVARSVIRDSVDSIEMLMTHAQRHAEKQLQDIAFNAQDTMQDVQNQALLRLKALAELNPNIRQEEIRALENETQQMASYLEHVDLKVDALRLIISI